MGNRVILSPQWVIDCITYVIRDYQLHRFRRDYRAMDLNKGEDWKALLKHGRLSRQLLGCLWIGERYNHRFMLLLMHKLGLFALLDDENFLVPSVVTCQTSELQAITLKNEEVTLHFTHFP